MTAVRRVLIGLVVVLLAAAPVLAQVVSVPPRNVFTEPVTAPDGTCAAPSWTYTSDTDTGFARLGANNVGACAGGVLRWDYNTTRLLSTIRYELGLSALGTTSTDGYVARNTTAATAGVPVQISPRDLQESPTWDTDDAVSRLARFATETIGTSAAAVTGTWRLGWLDPVTSAITYPLTVTSAGAMSALARIGVGIAVDATEPLIVGQDRQFSASFRSADATGGLSRLLFQSSRGTNAAPTASALNDELGLLRGEFYDGAAFRRGADIRFTVASVVASDNAGIELGFYTRPTGGGGDVTKRVLIAPDGRLETQALFANKVDARTIASTGDANPATLTLTPTASYVEITCNDPDTCDITMGETGIAEGTVVTIVNVSTNIVDFADTVGVTEIAGPFAAGQFDAITLRYSGAEWVETQRSNN